jgi:hypothetical protein
VGDHLVRAARQEFRDVDRQSAIRADDVVVSARLAIEPFYPITEIDFSDRAYCGEYMQQAVDGCEAGVRNLFAQLGVDPICGRVLVRGVKNPEYRGSLFG